MRLLLINTNTFKQPWPVIPYGLCCVAASLESAGHDVRVLDLCFAHRQDLMIKYCVEHYQPDVIGVSVRNIDNSVGYNTLFLLENTRKYIINPCKNYYKGPIVIGGPAVGINGKELLDYFDLDLAISGDGETAMIELVKRIENRATLDDMPGLVLRKQSGLILENPPWRVKNLDDLPYVNPGRYINLREYAKFNSPLQIQTKRGCALNCKYCTYKRIEGSQYRLRNPAKLAEEISRLVSETGIRFIEFTDSTFNIPLKHAKEVLREIINRDLRLELRTMGLNPGAVDKELVDLMKAAGFREVDLGAEAGSDRMLQSLGKNYTKQSVLQAGKLLREAGIPTTWYILLGAPGETPDTVRETFDTINRAAYRWDLVNIGVGIRVYKGAPIADMVREHIPNGAHNMYLLPTTLPTKLTMDIEHLKFMAKLEAYRNPNYFLYDEDEKTPIWVLRIASLLIKFTRSRHPIWRLHILLRKIQQVFGIQYLKRRWTTYVRKGDNLNITSRP